MLEIKERSKLAVKIYGQEFEVLKPNVMQTRVILQKIGELKDAVAVTDAWIEFLVGLGFPKELLESMEPEHLMTLIDFVSGVKKK